MNTVTHFLSNTQWLGTSTRPSDIYTPATGAVLGKVTLASASDMDKVVETAAAAAPGWAATPPAKRATVMFEFRDLLKKHTDEQAELLSAEHGRTLPDAKGDIVRGIEVVEFGYGIPQVLKGEYPEAVSVGVDSFSGRTPRCF